MHLAGRHSCCLSASMGSYYACRCQLTLSSDESVVAVAAAVPILKASRPRSEAFCMDCVACRSSSTTWTHHDTSVTGGVYSVFQNRGPWERQGIDNTQPPHRMSKINHALETGPDSNLTLGDLVPLALGSQ